MLRFLNYYNSISSDVMNGVNKLEEKAIFEYNQALLMPRKKKKKAKASAILLYNIAQHGKEYFQF
jgi:hypothetical protein